ncbi:serine/arginine repetitive matrix protein 1-like [Sinocyclocheilus grahami]|uniref:Serine/arginine repetitive matrix protein 1-like n=1 Tax=Sinocyclocheilus grahami TaxID=75366 RepID=A0A672QE52_SINGR|nr:PREDICTED: serine/arginine repetitive matrix protein 1-like [Sinocyclocheilus grahami]XP_016137224.1 PREDICTED: serine/arginine repetitive matrix protein 1-like [Sinocyclocheilus grahami]XP_016137225.1 PREDICTED: serine/arginine repetitive matrix protein 1-like [Sinocyclocheilus grahami]XP_016137226.1 PREDICTED: serine/arginine repetitive matrix protein 1-like [Sinocyclocheilus grahami]XP_016137227.1 PREDICTED: serine/arginine repetitive matrix protein 1-like [Sinocyclocheilus grahami]
MVRQHSGSPRSKHRPFSDSYSSMNHEGRFGPPSRSQRGFRGPPGKAPPSWRDNNSSGPQPYPKRPSLMGERRERPHGQWMQNQNNFHPYSSSQDSQRGRRRPSPPRTSRPPPVQHRQSLHGPIHGPHSHRAPLFHNNHPSHTSPSRHFHGPPSDRRVPSPHSSFRGPQRRPSPQEHDRSWCPTPRERPFGRPTLGGHHWNGPGGYPHPPGGDSRLSGPPHRKPREFHGRSSYPERWSAERDQRAPHGEVGREFRRAGMEWARGRGGNPHTRPPYRSPARRPGPPPSGSSFRPYPPFRPQERPFGRPMKRNSQEFRRPPSSSGLEHGPPKRFSRELSVRPVPLRGFRGRGLSLQDKSRLLKAQKFRAESVARFKVPPPRPRISDRVQKPKPQTAPKNGKDSPGVSPRKLSLKKMSSSRESSPNTDSKTAEPERDSETKVESRRSVSAHSSSPIDRRLSRDLVVVSHWEAGHKPSTSPKNNAPWRNKAPKNKSEESEAHGNLTLNERFTKLQSPTSSSQEQKERRSSGSPENTQRKPGSFQRPNCGATAGVKRGAAPDGVIRKPLMGTLIPRPPFNQKPVFKKSQSIMSKYKNLQTLRHKVPHQRQATSYRRW